MSIISSLVDYFSILILFVQGRVLGSSDISDLVQ